LKVLRIWPFALRARRRHRFRRSERSTSHRLTAEIDRLEIRTLLSGTDGPIISEIVASNSGGLADSDGDHPDWIELYNPTAETIDLAGWTLTDDPEVPDLWKFPETPLAPGAFLVVFASGKDRAVAGQELHTNFKLSADGEYLGLYKPDESIAYEFSPAFPQQASDVSYGVNFDTTELVAPGATASVKVPTDNSIQSIWNTPGYVPDQTWLSGQTGIGFGILQPGFVVHYVKSNIPVGDLSTAEGVLAEPSLQSTSITTSAETINYLNTGSGANFSGDQPFPSQTIGVDVDDFVIEATAQINIPSTGQWSFGVNSDDGFGLTLERDGQVLTSSYPDPRGPGDTISVFNVPEAGQWDARLVYYERGGGSEVELFAAQGNHTSFDGGAFDLVGDTADGGLSAGSILTDDPGDDALVGQWVADDLNGQSDGSAVTSWADRAAGGNGPIVATAGGAPQLEKSALNGHSAVVLNSDDFDNFRVAAASNPLDNAGDFTAAVVFETSSAGTGAQGDWYGNSGLVDAYQAGESDDWGLAFDADGEVAAGNGNPDVSVYSKAPALDDGRAHLAVMTRASGVLSVYVDGVLQDSRTDAGQDPRAVGDLVFGSLQTNSNYFDGKIAEVRLYDNDLTGDQILRLTAELNARYSLPEAALPTVGTDIGAVMRGVNSSAYIRIPFSSPDPSQFGALTLKMQYNDGFVAFLNGVKVASANAPGSLSFDSVATAARAGDATAVATFSLASDLNLLHAGTNVLAIQGLNQSADDADFLIRPELIGSRVHTDELRYFTTPTPGGPNQGAYLGMVSTVQASVERGFFSAPFTVSLETTTPGATLVYTLDGSEPTASNGAVYAGPLSVDRTTTLRFAAFEAGYLSQPSVAETYIFLSDVLTQSPDGSAPAGWPTSWGGNVVDYGMDPNIVNNPTYGGAELEAALLAIPSISITTNLANLFDPATGIYANAYQQGIDWERPASVELINPDGSQGFQIDAGLRIRGGYSRSGDNPKHAFRLFFRSEYGESALDFPLFGTEGTDSFAKVDLRTAENYSWSFDGSPNNNFVAEVFSRDTMAAMGEPYTRSRFYQLYIDGQYWGLYQTEERPDANYAASYFGGDKDNYDVVKVETGPYTIQATDGNLDAWYRLWSDVTDPKVDLADNAEYYKLLGKNPDGSDNPNYEVLVDPGELADYMITILYGGNLDAPISSFLGNQYPNNFFAIRDRTGRQGFQFLIHDAEHTLLDPDENRNGPYPAGSDFDKFNPQYLHQQLMQNAEYRLLFADHVQKAFFNDGVLTPANAIARFQDRAGEISQAIDGESARWGDAKRPGDAFTVADWQAAVDRVEQQYMPIRSGIVLQQFMDNGLFPTVPAPIFQINGSDEHGGSVAPGDLLSFTAPGAIVFYTLDGSDPRAIGGGFSDSALIFQPGQDVPIALAHTSRVTARAFLNGTWSAIDSVQFNINVPAAAGNLAVTELDYHPAAPDLSKGELDVDREEFEFVELKNFGDQEINLAGVQFTTGIAFDFTNAAITTLAPGAYVVIAKDLAAFESRYGTGLPVAGSYGGATGGLASLSNKGEQLTLLGASGATIESFTFGTKAPWPTQPDGGGPSLVAINPLADGSDGTNWRVSVKDNGNPGKPDDAPPSISAIDNQTIDEDHSTGDLSFTIGDALTPADSLIVTVLSNNPTLLPTGSMMLGGSGTDRTLRLSPAANGNGSATVTISVTDGGGTTALSSFLLTVNAVDDPPVGMSDSYTASEDTTLSIKATVGLLANDTDVEGDPMTALPDTQPAHGKLTLNPDGSFTYVSDLHYFGPDTFSYRPSDGTLSGNVTTVTLEIAEVDEPPTLSEISPKSVDEEAQLSFTAVASDPNFPTIGPRFALVAGAPVGASIDATTGLFTWTPSEAQGPAVYSISVRATGNGTPPLSVIQTFQVTVNEVNTAPVIDPIPDAKIIEGGTFTVIVRATDRDIPGNVVLLSLDPGSPAGATINPLNGVLSWKPSAAQSPGDYQFIVRATDNGTPTLSSVRTFTVTETAVPPVVSPPSGIISISAAGSFSVVVPFSEAGHGPWTAMADYGDGSAVEAAPVGDDQIVHLAHHYATGGSYNVIVRLTDSRGATGVGNLAVAVQSVPLVTISPGVVGKTKKGQTTIGLVFSGAVTGAASLADYKLISAGKDKKFGTRDDKTVALKSVAYDGSNAKVKLTTKKAVVNSIGPVKLSVSAATIADSYGRAVDADGDGKAGGSFVVMLAKRKLTIASAFVVRARARRVHSISSSLSVSSSSS
jgi:hypothetical protein